MTTRLLGAAVAAAVLLVLSTPARADIVVLQDGTVYPSKIKDLKPGAWPSPTQLRSSGRGNATLSFGRVKIGKKEVSAAQIRDIFTTAASLNTDFNDGETYANSGDFAGAAHRFGLAAQELGGADKQVALYKRMVALRAVGKDLAAIAKSADELIAADPQGYYVPEAQLLRARIFSSQGKAKAALGALNAITAAAGMNARDYFDAELTKLDWFDLRSAGNDAAKLTKLEQKYRNLERQANAKGKDARVQMLKAVVGSGRCLVRMQKYAAAKKAFERVTNDSTIENKTLFGAAYHGLGDAVYGQAKLDMKGGTGDPKKLAKAQDTLTIAALHYLRVTEFYGNDWAADDVLDCTMNLARVFANQYTLGGGKDCAVGRRAYRYYVQSANAMSRGEAKTQLIREARAFKKDLDVACPK